MLAGLPLGGTTQHTPAVMVNLLGDAWYPDAAATGRREPAWERVLAHPRYGPIVRQWRERGSVPRRAKWMASAMMVLSAGVMWFTPTPRWLFAGVCSIMLIVAIWLWRRPES